LLSLPIPSLKDVRFPVIDLRQNPPLGSMPAYRLQHRVRSVL
jgi:hypothetical protein